MKKLLKIPVERRGTLVGPEAAEAVGLLPELMRDVQEGVVLGELQQRIVRVRRHRVCQRAVAAGRRGH